jgi:hypothetical protein
VDNDIYIVYSPRFQVENLGSGSTYLTISEISFSVHEVDVVLPNNSEKERCQTNNQRRTYFQFIENRALAVTANDQLAKEGIILLTVYPKHGHKVDSQEHLYRVYF